MFVCGCANPACQVNGCQIANDLRNKHSPNPYPNQWGGGGPAVPLPQVITVEQIRQIIREELAAMKDEIGRGMK